MKNKIQILSKDIIDQISSGDVIQRPSSIVRELLENSIDANATKIDLFIKDAGKSSIQLLDNGEGMNYEDAKMSFRKYATSKILHYDDLLNIKTKGFRGEALFSISHVSQLEIKTRDKTSSIGIHFYIENGKIKKEIPLNMNIGTRIIVNNIFYRFPVRKNNLKSNKIEFKCIIDEFYKIIIAHRNKTYRLYHNKKMILFFNKTSLINRIKEIFKIEKRFFKSINITYNKILINGIINIPNNYTKRKGKQIIFINERNVKYLSLHKQIIYPYKNITNNIYSISYFIFIYLNPKFINWNIHPSKQEVKIENEKLIGDILKNKIQSILYYNVKMINIDSYYNKKNHSDNILKLENLIQNILNRSRQSNFYVEKINYELFDKKKQNNIIQINKKYIIFSSKSENDLVIIDQHKAHSQILYEFLMESNRKIIIKNIIPITIKLSDKEFEIFNFIKNDLQNLGFYFYVINKYIYLYNFPNKIQEYIKMSSKIFKKILLHNNYLKYNEIKLKYMLIESISDIISLQDGKKLLIHQMIKLIEELLLCKNKIYNYYGDPILFIFNKFLFKKLF